VIDWLFKGFDFFVFLLIVLFFVKRYWLKSLYQGIAQEQRRKVEMLSEEHRLEQEHLHILKTAADQKAMYDMLLHKIIMWRDVIEREKQIQRVHELQKNADLEAKYVRREHTIENVLMHRKIMPLVIEQVRSHLGGYFCTSERSNEKNGHVFNKRVLEYLRKSL
jgi:hypothetical protein